MYLEISQQGKKKKYFLTHSYRENSKVKKLRRYLGSNLSSSTLKKLRVQAKILLQQQIEQKDRVLDPFHTVLSSKEAKSLNYLIPKRFTIAHLDKKQWRLFSESFTYNTNAIEGSTITLQEVKNIVEKDKWPDKSKVDIAETQGLYSAINSIKLTQQPLSIALIKRLHQIVFRNSQHFAGILRKKGIDVVIKDQFGTIIHQGAPSTRINHLLKEMIQWYEENKKKYHPLVLAAVVHNQFETIHPFQDGNGRVGRLLLNYILLRHKMPPSNITMKHRKEYYRVLYEYQHHQNLRPTIEFLLREYNALKKQLQKKV